MTDCASFYGFYALFQEAQGNGGGGGKCEETKGDIDKDGGCRGVYSGVMQLYDALFHLAWAAFMVPLLGWTEEAENRGVETETEDTLEPSHRTEHNNRLCPLWPKVGQTIYAEGAI